jgi:hypothetical protein
LSSAANAAFNSPPALSSAARSRFRLTGINFGERRTTNYKFSTGLMKTLLVIIVILIVAGSIFADYKWREWLARNRRDRDQ